MTLNGPLESVHSFEDYHITNEEDGNDVLVRLYKHDIEPSSDLIIYIHGGGWTQGNLKNYAYLCRKLTKILEKDVLAVDYRLSPENPHPQQLNDIMAVYKYFLKSKYKKIYLSGDSGGGHLCASTCIKINDEGLKRPHGSILFYPALDNDFNSRSFKAFNCPALTKKGTMDYTNNLVGGNCLDPKNFSNKYIFPSLQKDMKVFPREILVSSGYDILFDGQLKHVKNMLKSGRKDLTWLVYPGVVHGFMNYGKFYDKLVTQVCQTVKKFLK
ncbi:alpha/beta-hydrolase [Neocallimastix californiae]|uniref:Alpha/beta-hydrolase n=1 Tax=Neocallimastix californiae TaxID=1754190 RepID=A0A1Y2BZY2_9FUNG|nr:alpha/beta-hydrolase [Neocallimastix californiae]|eukprot:ORY40319.1 alpha/beta-hydrolase [Neocallimastix californiae]